MHMPWRRIETCGPTEDQAALAAQKLCILLPPPESSWALVDSEATALLNDVATYAQNSLPTATYPDRKLTFQQLFKLRRIIECLTICGFECELLQTWKSELNSSCREFTSEIIKNYPEQPLEQLASNAKIFLTAVRALAEAGVPLDASYTLKTPDVDTRLICCNALKQCLARSDEFQPQSSALDALVASIWTKIIQKEALILAEPMEIMIKSLEDTIHLSELQTLSEFLSCLDVVTSDFLSVAVDTFLDVVFAELQGSIKNVTDQSLVIKKLLRAVDAIMARIPIAFRGDCYRPMRSLFSLRLKVRLFHLDEAENGLAGMWLTQPYHRRQVIDLNGIWKPIIETQTTFEWIFLHDSDSWRALNSLAADSEAYVNNVLVTWSKFMSRTCAGLVEECADVTPAALTKSLLVWLARLTALPEALFGKAVAKHAREALLTAFKNTPVVCEAFTEYVETLWHANAPDIDYTKLVPIFRALANKALAQSLLEAALLRTLLIKNTPMRNCTYFIELLQAECGENYVSNMKAALNEFTDIKPRSSSDEPEIETYCSDFLAVKVISARLYNSQCASDKKVNPSATCSALPCWSVPPSILQGFQNYIDAYKERYNHRLLTFALEVSSATIIDLRTDHSLEVSASQYILLNLFNAENTVSSAHVKELYKDGQGELVVSSLAPLVLVGEDGSVTLNDPPPTIIDYRGQWLSQWSGSDHTGTGTNSPLQAAIRASITLFYDVGLDALIMRTLKQKTCEFRLLKAAVDLYALERFGSHLVPESTIREHLERLKARDFISIDQNIISLTN